MYLITCTGCLNVCPVGLFLTAFLSDYFVIGGLRNWLFRIECFLHGTPVYLVISAPQWSAGVCITVFIFDTFIPLNKKCVHRGFFNWLYKCNTLNVVVHLCTNTISEFLKYWITYLHII